MQKINTYCQELFSPSVSVWHVFAQNLLENIMQLQHSIVVKAKKKCSLNFFSQSTECVQRMQLTVCQIRPFAGGLSVCDTFMQKRLI